MNNVIEWAKNIGTIGKAITTIAAVLALIVTGLFYYQPRASAEAQHQELMLTVQEARSQLAAYDEIGQLETNIKIKQLEIRQLNATRERRELTPDEETSLELAQATMQLLQERLRDLQAVMRGQA